MTKVVDFRAKSDDELQTLQQQLVKEQFNLRFQKATGQMSGTARVRVIRRDLARIATILNERLRAAKPARAGKAA